MRWAFLMTMVVAGAALADVPGPRPTCLSPAECRSCSRPADEASGQCEADAADAGMSKVACTERHGSVFTEYYCPPGYTVREVCGCSTTGAASGLVALLGALGLRRRRAGR